MQCMNHPVTILLTIRADDRSGLVDFLRQALPLYESPGGIRVRLLQKLDDPRSFIEVIEYEDRATYEEDQVRIESQVEMRTCLETWRGLLAGPPIVESYYDVTDDLRI